MKRLIIAAILFLNFFNSFCQSDGNSLLGKWTMKDERNDIYGIEFMPDGKANLLISGEKQVVNYKIDYSKNPISIDLTSNISGKKITQFCLASFIDKNKIRFEICMATDARPVKFSEELPPMMLIRK